MHVCAYLYQYLYIDGYITLMRGKTKPESRCLEPVTKDTHQYLSTKPFKCDCSELER